MYTHSFENQTILITGGAGSLGKNLVTHILKHGNPKKVIVFSRDEFKHLNMEHQFADDRLRFFIGDVRDKERLERAFRGVDIVIHVAALKQVPILEYNPHEAIKTNINGSQNVIEAAIDQGVKKVLLISTDKAAQPNNLYGATKLCAEKLFVAANSYAAGKTILSAVRYGNVVGSRGSIVDILRRSPDTKAVKITDPNMTRFWITLDQAVELVLFALEHMEGGEVFIPKIPSMKLGDLFTALAPTAKQDITGIRPGEKIHEVLVTEDESRHAIELAEHFVILPEFIYFAENLYAAHRATGKPMHPGSRYASETNSQWLDQNGIKKMIESLTISE